MGRHHARASVSKPADIIKTDPKGHSGTTRERA
jgi:hypothetical protein